MATATGFPRVVKQTSVDDIDTERAFAFELWEVKRREEIVVSASLCVPAMRTVVIQATRSEKDGKTEHRWAPVVALRSVVLDVWTYRENDDDNDFTPPRPKRTYSRLDWKQLGWKYERTTRMQFVAVWDHYGISSNLEARKPSYRDGCIERLLTPDWAASEDAVRIPALGREIEAELMAPATPTDGE